MGTQAGVQGEVNDLSIFQKQRVVWAAHELRYLQGTAVQYPLPHIVLGGSSGCGPTSSINDQGAGEGPSNLRPCCTFEGSCRDTVLLPPRLRASPQTPSRRPCAQG